MDNSAENTCKEQERLRVRPLSMPEYLADLLSFRAHTSGTDLQELLVAALHKELQSDSEDCTADLFVEGTSSTVKLLAKIPALLDAELVRRAEKIERSPNYVILHALLRELNETHGESVACGVPATR